MARVPETDSRYKTAQDRVAKYQENSEMALQKAKQIQDSAPEASNSGAPSENAQTGEEQPTSSPNPSFSGPQ
jgi:phage shock protein A